MPPFDMAILVALGLMAILVAAVAIWNEVRKARHGTQHDRDFRRARFLDELERVLELGERDGGTIEGILDPDERRASVEVVKEVNPSVVFEVEVRAAPRMRFTLETPSTRIKKALHLVDEVQTGDKQFDDLLFIETANDQETRHHLARGPALRKKILRAFERYGVESLELKDGVLRAVAPLGALRRMRDYPRLLDLLAGTARAFDRVGIKVKVLDGERLALAGHGGKARCAYCHADLSGEEPDLVACEKCGTVLHAGCYDELGKCPILGCTGSTPERAPVR